MSPFSLLLPGKFFTIRNMQSMAVQFPEFGILAFAIMITMLTGGIDLSIVGTANLSAIAAALTLTRLTGDGAGLPLVVAIPLAIFVALFVGSALRSLQRLSGLQGRHYAHSGHAGHRVALHRALLM